MLAELNQRPPEQDFNVTQAHDDDYVRISFSGSGVAQHVERAIPVLREAIATGKWLKIDFSASQEIDSRFLGLLLLVRKTLKARGMALTLTGLSPGLERVFRLNGLSYLLSEGREPSA